MLGCIIGTMVSPQLQFNCSIKYNVPAVHSDYTKNQTYLFKYNVYTALKCSPVFISNINNVRLGEYKILQTCVRMGMTIYYWG